MCPKPVGKSSSRKSTPRTANSPEWWNYADGKAIAQIELDPLHLADRPSGFQVFSRIEMKQFGACQHANAPASDGQAQPYKDIIQAAIALEAFLDKSHVGYPTPSELHKPDQEYMNQEWVNLCCLVDRGRVLDVDTQNATKTRLSVRTGSYLINPDASLKSYLFPWMCIQVGSRIILDSLIRPSMTIANPPLIA
jgi:hypothetical protein